MERKKNCIEVGIHNTENITFPHSVVQEENDYLNAPSGSIIMP
jgi:hypothetical protein